MIIIGVVLLLVATWLYWRYMHLQNDLAKATRAKMQLQTELALSEGNVTRLRNVLNAQNERIDAIAKISQARAERIEEVKQDLDESREAEYRAVQKLKDAEGSTCTDGIDLIDQELGL